MLYAMIINTLIAITRLSIPFILLYAFVPGFILSPLGIILGALAIGAYLAYNQYSAAQTQLAALQFVPTEECAQEFNSEVERCGVDANALELRYSYTAGGIAQTNFNFVCIDPTVWQGVEGDEQAKKATEVIEKFIAPNAQPLQKSLRKQIKADLSIDVQKFIFRHELSHIVSQYSKWRVITTGIIGFAFTAVGLVVARNVGAMLVLPLGIFAATVVDVCGALASTAFVRLPEEKNADIFAARYSSRQEIEAAADFFEKYEKCVQENQGDIGVVKYLPVEAIRGYPADRPQFLRELAQNK